MENSSDEGSSDTESVGNSGERTCIIATANTDAYYGSIPSERTIQRESSPSSISARLSRRKRHTLRYYIFYLILGFLAICLAGYILSYAAINIIDELSILDVLFGIVILAIATTLPEKFVAVMSGRRERVGILVANTAGSNIFLLALCAGTVMLDTSGQVGRGNVGVAELGVLWGSTLAFTGTIWGGGGIAK